MNNKVNYTFIGLLVLVGLVSMVAFSYWMLKPSDETETKTYAIDFDESVLGLNIDAPVKYRGISVGKVSAIGINETNAEQVRVLVTILKTTPIKEDTVAQLTAQGITGLSYINLSLGSNSAPELKKLDSQPYALIKTAPSFMTNLEESFSSVSTRLTSTLGRTEKLLGNKNQEQLSKLLERTANVMEKMDAMLDEKTIKHVQNSAKNLDELSSKLNAIAPNIDDFIAKSILFEDKIASSFESIMTSYLGIKASMEEVKRAVSSGEFNVKEISADLIPTLNATFLEMQELMIKLQETLESHQKSPSDILYKSREIHKAPGE